MFTKIKNEDFKDKDVSSISANPLLGDATTNKALFDKSAKEVLMPAINRLIDELLNTNAPKHIGAEGGTLEELLNGLKKSLSDVPGEIDKKVAEAIAQVVAEAPESLDTLKELSDWINEHANSAAEMNRAIAGKVDKAAGMGLSETDFTATEKTKLSNIEVGANHSETSIFADGYVVTTAYPNIQIDRGGSIDGEHVYINTLTDDDCDKLDGIEEGAQVNVIERVSLDGTPLEITEKGVNIPLSTDTYRGMKKVGTTELTAENNNISIKGLSLSRGFAKLTLPTETREVSGRPIGYLVDSNGTLRTMTAYSSGIGKDISACFVIEFDMLSQIAKTTSYAVYKNIAEGEEATITETKKAMNIGGNVTGVQFYYAGAFPAGTTLELWGE